MARPRYHCESYEYTGTLNVGEFVSMVDNETQRVQRSQTASIGTNPAVGVCVEVLGSNWCIVQHCGLTAGIFSGLAPGDAYYAANNGGHSTSGAQLVGVAISSTTMFIMLNLVQSATIPDKSVGFCVFLSGTDVATGDGTAAATIGSDLNGWDVVDVIATVGTAGTTGTTDVQLRRRRGTSSSGTDVDVLSTKAKIDSGERSSTTGTSAVVNTSNDDLATGDQLYIDVDAVSSGTKPKGLSVAVVCRKP